MSLLLFALITCGAAASGFSAGLFLRRGALQRARAERTLAGSSVPVGGQLSASVVEGAPHVDSGEDPLPMLPIGLGDVVTRGDEEAALTEALVLSEDGVLHAALLRGAGPASSPWIWSAPSPATEAVWLHEHAHGTAAHPDQGRSVPGVLGEGSWRGGEAPLSLEIGSLGRVFERRRRLPVVVTHIPEGPADGQRRDTSEPDGGELGALRTHRDEPDAPPRLARFAGDALLHEYVADGGQAAYLLVPSAGQPLLFAGQVCTVASLLEHRLPGPRRAS
jgi:hypothetical protein